MGSCRSCTVWPPTVAEMTGVDTESLTEAVSGSGKKIPLLCSENHTPTFVTSLSRVTKSEEGSWIEPRMSELEGSASLAILRGAVCSNRNNGLHTFLQIHTHTHTHTHTNCHPLYM